MIDRKKLLVPKEVSLKYRRYYDFSLQQTIQGKLRIYCICPECNTGHWSHVSSIRHNVIKSPICKHCVGLVNLRDAPSNKISKEKLVKRIQDRAKELKRNPTIQEIKGKNTILKNFGTWNNALYQAGLIPFVKKGVRLRKYMDYGPIPNHIPDSLGYFLAGFVAGEGCFTASPDRREKPNGYSTYIRAAFLIGLNIRDLPILQTFQNTLGCGKIYFMKNGKIVHFAVNARKDLIQKVIPFFRKFQFCNTYKQQQFERWCEVVELLNQNFHLTPDGQELVAEKARRINR